MRKLWKPAGIVALPLTLFHLIGILYRAPIESTMGEVQKIFYVHVPCSWASFLAFATVFGASIVYLWKRSEEADRIAACAAEVGMIFLTIVLVTGPIWGKRAWQTWWSWDPRLTTTLVLWILYFVYNLLRPLTENSEKGARFAAVLGIVGFLDVPLIYFSVQIWHTLHPGHVIDIRTGSHLDPSMLHVFLFGLLVWTVYLVFLLGLRLEVDALKEAVEVKKEREG